MTDQEIADLGPAFAAYLRRFRGCFLQGRTARHLDTYCHGLLSGLGRKSVEPVALEAGTAVRTLQAFLTTAVWDHGLARDTLQRHLKEALDGLPSDALGTVGVFDETSAKKQGDKTPGVQRQYLGCLGKVDNGIVTVHVGVAKGRFQALLDGEPYLPRSWDEDRDRCRQAGIPDEVGYRPKWRIAFDQLLRLDALGVKFDWLTFDEGYGAMVPLLALLTLAGQKFVAEVPVSFSVRVEGIDGPVRADELLTFEDARGGRRHRVRQETRPGAWWRADSWPVAVRGRDYLLVAAVSEATAEVKYFVTNATGEAVQRVLEVAFRRATVEHNFRLAKTEVGLTHYEGRQYTGLIRHLTLALLVLGFVSIHTDRLRGEKPARDAGAGVPGAERAVRPAVPAEARHRAEGAGRRGHPLPPEAQRAGHALPQEAAA
jgi:SRSO17 transposase